MFNESWQPLSRRPTSRTHFALVSAFVLHMRYASFFFYVLGLLRVELAQAFFGFVPQLLGLKALVAKRLEMIKKLVFEKLFI